MPASLQSIPEFYAHPRIAHDIANVASLRAVLCHDPELPVHKSVAHRRTALLSGLAAGRFQEPISRRSQADREQKLHGRVEHVF